MTTKLRELEAKVVFAKNAKASAETAHNEACKAVQAAKQVEAQAAKTYTTASNALREALQELTAEQAIVEPLTAVQRRVLTNASKGTVAESTTAERLYQLGFLYRVTRSFRLNDPPRYRITDAGLAKLQKGTP